MSMGAAVGVWAVARIQRAASHMTPTGMANDAQRFLSRLETDVRAAVREGARTKREVEADLRPSEQARRGARSPATRPIEAQATEAPPALPS